MGGVAALARAAGHEVTGCDRNVYPPMSTQLKELGIDIHEGMDADQLAVDPDCVVVGNIMSRGVEVKDSRRVGDGSHLKLTLRDKSGRELSAIAFGLGEKDPGAGARIDVAYVPAVTTWMGRRRLELTIKDLWEAGP